MTITSVVLAGGGTAGHVNPLLSVADEIRRRDPDAEILVLGTEEGLESDLVPARGFELKTIPRTPIKRELTLEHFTLPKRFIDAYRQTRTAIEEAHAQAVVGFGGYVSGPAYLAAHRLGVPIVVHEGNARAGLTNRIGARWAEKVGVTFPTTKLPKAELTGLPMREEITDLAAQRAANADELRNTAAAKLGLDPALPTVLVSGGSTGALSINTAVSEAAGDLVGNGIQVLHLTGKGKAAPVQALVAGIAGQPGADHYHVREYLPEMQLALACADLVITRAGAGMVCELSALGMPAIYVPLPFGNGEQRQNVLPLIQAGGGVLVKDDEMTADWVREHVPSLVTDRALLASMAKAAREQGRPDAAAAMVNMIDYVVEQGERDKAQVAKASAETREAGRAARAREADGPSAHLIAMGVVDE